MKGKHLSTVVLAIPTSDGLYGLEALGTKNEVGDDEEVRQSFNTFRFLHPPGPPQSPQDAAYRAGYLFGQVFIPVAILGLIVWGITKAVSRRNPPVPAAFRGRTLFPRRDLPTHAAGGSNAPAAASSRLLETTPGQNANPKLNWNAPLCSRCRPW